MTWLLFMTAISYTFFVVPLESEMGIVQKIFYLHVPMAVTAFSLFFLAFLFSIFYLRYRDRKWDVLAASSVEIGVLLTTMVLITGSLWARPIWNTWWTWDPRLTATFILWLIYASYLVLRLNIESEGKRAVFSAVIAIVGFIDVPIVFLSARIWRSIHPVVVKARSIGMEPKMGMAILIFTASFFFLVVVLLWLRTSTIFLGNKIHNLERAGVK
jgi:heme exporter protein C